MKSTYGYNMSMSTWMCYLQFSWLCIEHDVMEKGFIGATSFGVQPPFVNVSFFNLVIFLRVLMLAEIQNFLLLSYKT